MDSGREDLPIRAHLDQLVAVREGVGHEVGDRPEGAAVRRAVRALDADAGVVPPASGLRLLQGPLDVVPVCVALAALLRVLLPGDCARAARLGTFACRRRRRCWRGRRRRSSPEALGGRSCRCHGRCRCRRGSLGRVLDARGLLPSAAGPSNVGLLSSTGGSAVFHGRDGPATAHVGLAGKQVAEALPKVVLGSVRMPQLLAVYREDDQR
mmetsp:Transcript_34944/g.104587  ORF Transcript_34944/g.104587 Transcript_34944/m.104587 type:complete len:210 (+) Transcript_34944:1059-1688(+)